MAASKPSAEQLITENIDVWTSAIKKRGSQGRGSSKKIELYGIKKLRELILELAVRGLLVPQDPTDEPASVLLEKIAAKKEQLIKNGKIKKQKTLPDISDDEKSFDLPKGWIWCSLSHLGIFSGGKTPSKSNSAYWDGDIPWVTPKDMKVNFIYDSQDHVTELAVNDGLAEIASESLLFVVRSGILRRKFPVAITKNICTVNQDLKILSLFDKTMSSYILIMMQGFESYILKNLTKIGTTVESLRFDDFSKHYFILPPELEQLRIDAKVSELMALCDQLEQQTESSLTAHQTLVETLLNTLLTAAQTTGTKKSNSQSNSNQESSFDQAWNRIAQHFDVLFATEHSIDQLKQTILQLAVMGKLVPQNPNDEPASVLLEKIAAEKEQLIKDKKIKKQKALPPIGDDEEPFELPQGWEWCNLQSLITIMDAGWSPACPPEPSPSNEIWGVLKTTAVQSMEYREYENKVLAANKEPRPQYEVKVGDILITRAGPKNRVGVSCLVQATRPKLMISDKVIRFHLVEMGMCERYLSLCLNAGATADYLDSTKSGMAESQMNISQDKLKAAPVPLAPAKEQFKIIKRVDELIALCDNLKAHISESQFTQLHLADAMAEQALN